MSKQDNLQEMISIRKTQFEYTERIWEEYQAKYTEQESFDKFDKDPDILAIQLQSDKLRIEILRYIKENHSSMSFESVIEALVSTGDAPNLLYDDDGRFAVESSGIQGIMFDKDKFSEFSGTWFTKEESWKPTVREALNHYLNTMFNDWKL